MKKVWIIDKTIHDNYKVTCNTYSIGSHSHYTKRMYYGFTTKESAEQFINKRN